MKVGVVLPINVSFDNFGDLQSNLYRIKRETGATRIAQYVAPNVPASQVIEFLNIVQMAGFTATHIGIDFEPGVPSETVYKPLLEAIKDNPGLGTFQVGHEPLRHGVSLETQFQHYRRMKELAPGVKLALGASREWFKYPQMVADGICDVLILSGLEWQKTVTTPCAFQEQLLIDNHTLSRQRAALLTKVPEIETTLQGWIGGEYCPAPIEEWKRAFQYISGPGFALPLGTVWIQSWGARSKEQAAGRVGFGAPDFAEHRAFLLSLAETPEPEPEPAPVLEYYPGGAVVPKTGEYIQVYPKTLTAGATFPRGYWSKYGFIKVQSTE